jgi:hypothetical protein
MKSGMWYRTSQNPCSFRWKSIKKKEKGACDATQSSSLMQETPAEMFKIYKDDAEKELARLLESFHT